MPESPFVASGGASLNPAEEVCAPAHWRFLPIGRWLSSGPCGLGRGNPRQGVFCVWGGAEPDLGYVHVRGGGGEIPDYSRLGLLHSLYVWEA